MSVTIRNLTIVIGGKTIVSHVDLDIADGERVGLIGSSGSGKSMIAIMWAWCSRIRLRR